MGTTWVRHGYGMGTAWVRHGYGMGTAWVRHGYGMGTVWVRHGYGMGTELARYWQHSIGTVCTDTDTVCVVIIDFFSGEMNMLWHIGGGGV